MSKLKALQTEWYQKLKDSGFEDIEDNQERLKTWHSSYFQIVRKKDFQEVSSYYYKLSHYLAGASERPVFLLDYFDMRAWELHADGWSLRDIANQLNQEGFKTNKDVVNKIVNELKKRLKIG